MATLKFITKNAFDSPFSEKYKDDHAVEDVISYIYDVKYGGYKTQGYIGGWAVNPEYAAYEMGLMSKLHHKNSGVRLRHWVITFTEADMECIQRRLPTYSRELALYRLGYEFSSYYAEKYQIVFAVHLDTEPGHLHFVANTVSYVDGKKHTGSKAEYYAYESYAKSVAARYGFLLYAVTDNSAAKHCHRFD